MADDDKPSLADRLRSRLNFSLATSVSLVVGVVLIALAATAWLAYSLDPTRIGWGDYMSLDRALTLGGLWLLACVTTYFTVRVWMNDMPLGDRGIRDGWDAGMRLLAQHGVSLNELPCFVVLGCQTRHQQEAWVGTQGFGTPPPASRSSSLIDWHLGEDRILLFCHDIGVYGGLLRHAERSAETAAVMPPPESHSSSAGDDEDQEVVVLAAPPLPVADPSLASADPGDDSDPDHDSDPMERFDASHPAATSAPPRAQLGTSSRAVSDALQALDRVDALVLDAQSVELEALVRQPLPESLSSIKTTECQRLLSECCERLRSGRFPQTAINGTLVMVDSRSLARGDAWARGIGRAIRSDLELLQRELGVASPVTMLVTENDHREDYLELCRKLQWVDQDKTPAIGCNFESEEIPTAESMHGLVDRTLSDIENRTHRFFRAPGALGHSDNHRLVRYLIRSRRWRSSLKTLMVESCAADGNTTEPTINAHSPIVSGLFVASACTCSVGRRFVQSVFRRMSDQQNHLAWTNQEQRRWSRHQRLVQGLAGFTVLLAILLMIQLWWVLTRE